MVLRLSFGTTPAIVPNFVPDLHLDVVYFRAIYSCSCVEFQNVRKAGAMFLFNLKIWRAKTLQLS